MTDGSVDPSQWRIRLLPDAPLAIPALAALLISEWPDYYGPSGPGDALTDLQERSRRSGLPLCIMAVTADGRPIATAALAAVSHGAAAGESPWLVGVVTAPEWRGKGAASALIGALEGIARNAGCRRLYSTTVSAAGLLRRRGWSPLRGLDDGYRVFGIDLTK